MIDRTGQVWFARRSSIDEFELCIVIRMHSFGPGTVDPLVCFGWMMRPIENLSSVNSEFGHFESQFRSVELGGKDKWLLEQFV